MHDADILTTLSVGFTAALAFGYGTHRLGLSPIVGYLLAGILVGPATPGFVANRELAAQLAEIGVILLMFGVGLQFHWEELLKVRKVAVPGAFTGCAVATLLGLAVGRQCGWPWTSALVFWLCLSVASTVVLVRVLSDHHDLHTPAGHIAVGWLVVEDLLTVLLLVLLPVFFPMAGAVRENLGVEVVLASLKLCGLVAGLIWAGGKIIPRLLARAAATGSRELFTLSVLVLALGIAVLSAKLFGASMALGAFLAGMVVGRSEFSYQAGADALPMRDAFAVLFFVSVGMLFDPRSLLDAPWLFVGTLAVVVVGKPLAALGLVLSKGLPPRMALATAVSLAQIGEFSFILAGLVRDLHLLPVAGSQVLVAASIVSISLNPLLYRQVGAMERWSMARPRLWAWLNRRQTHHPDASVPAPSPSVHRALVVGYGPVGRTVARLLRDSDIEPVIIEMNLDTVRALRAQGIPSLYGDARHPDILRAAGVEKAVGLVLSASGMVGSGEIIRQATQLNPGIRVVARTAYLREAAALQKAGAHAVFSGEGEVALTLTGFLLGELGATPEQIERERGRIREELFGS